MSYDIKIPSVGESVLEVIISEWCKRDGDFVKVGDVLLVLETDKASVEIEAEKSGVLKILKPKGSTVPIGSHVGTLEPGDEKTAGKAQKTTSKPVEAVNKKPGPQIDKQTQPLSDSSSNQKSIKNLDTLKKFSPATRHLLINHPETNRELVEKLAQEKKFTKQSSERRKQHQESTQKTSVLELTNVKKTQQQRTETKPLSNIRRVIARRLKEVQNTAAILTTFNEIDLTDTMQLRQQYQEEFIKKHGVKLGLMSLFIKACIEGLKTYPLLNGFIKDDHLVYNHFYNIGVAVSTPRGLMVPVLKDADQKSLAQIEIGIKEFAQNARDGKISIDDLSGGTFSITNGGTFGSLLSTPILNPPQSGILGMHAINDRPMVINGDIKIRKMMYVALSYDHRIVDGREAVSFLVKVKENMQDIRRILLQI